MADLAQEQYSAGGDVDRRHQGTSFRGPTNWVSAPPLLREASGSGVTAVPFFLAWLPRRCTPGKDCGTVVDGRADRDKTLPGESAMWRSGDRRAGPLDYAAARGQQEWCRRFPVHPGVVAKKAYPRDGSRTVVDENALRQRERDEAFRGPTN